MGLTRPLFNRRPIRKKRMAKLQVTEPRCDRCKRVEYLSEEEVDAKNDHEVVLKIVNAMAHSLAQPVVLEYQDLCKPCRKTVGRLLEAIAKPINGMSPDRVKTRAKKGGAAAPSLVSPPLSSGRGS